MSSIWFPQSVLSLSLAMATLSPLYAAELTRHYLIPAGSLSAALLAVSQQSKQLIVFNPKDLEARSALALEGDFSQEQILRRLLDGHGLTFEHDSRGAVIVKPSAEKPVTESPSAGQAPAAGTLSLPVMVVYGDSLTSNGLATTATATTRTGTPLRLTPQSITVINSDIMQAQGARTVADALKNVAGVTVMPSSLGSASVNVRGYQSSVLSEGMNSSGLSTPLAVPAIALQSVETLKGPGAILSGAGSPGGTINLVYKKPQLEEAHEVQLGYGSFAERVLSADTTGALFGSEHLSYRVILESKQSNTNAGGYDGLKGLYFSPSIRWQDEDTDVTLRYTRTQRTTPFEPYTVMYNGRPYTGRLPEPLGNKQDSLHLQQNEFNLSLEQSLSEHWKYVAKATYTTAKMNQYGWYTGTPLADDGTVWMNTFAQGGESHQLNLDNYVRGSYEWDGLKSTTVLGVSAARTRGVSHIQSGFRDWEVVNINEPLPELPSAKASYTERFSQSIPVGAYWQQQLSYGRWNLNAGLRFDSSWNGVFRRNEATDSQNNQVWSPSIGLAYEAAPWLTVYANHLKGYQPPTYLDRNGNLLPEQTSVQSEAGLKFTLLGERLVVTSSVYKIEFSNYAYFDRDEAGYVATPGYVSRGFEVEAQGALTPDWDVVGHYNFGKTEFAEDSDFHAGLPRHHASVWTRYQFRDGALKGVSVGAGVYYTGLAYLDRDRENHIPAQVQTDLNLGYAVGNYSLDLTARNIFDENLYVTSMDGDLNFIALQQPRMLQLTASYRF